MNVHDPFSSAPTVADLILRDRERRNYARRFARAVFDRYGLDDNEALARGALFLAHSIRHSARSTGLPLAVVVRQTVCGDVDPHVIAFNRYFSRRVSAS